MLGPTVRAWRRAGEQQQMAFNEGFTSPTSAEERDVAVAIVHTRQDVVLICSMLNSVHDQLVTISRGIWILCAIVVVMGAAALSHPT
jgi:hypothetical protein